MHTGVEYTKKAKKNQEIFNKNNKFIKNVLQKGKKRSRKDEHEERNVAQPGSAHVWGACGRGFKSRHSDH